MHGVTERQTNFNASHYSRNNTLFVDQPGQSLEMYMR